MTNSKMITHREHNKNTLAAKIVFGIVSVIFALYAITVLFSIFWIIISSLKSADDFQLGLHFFPEVFVFENYPLALSSITYHGITAYQMLFNSLWYAFGGSFVGIMTATCFSYVVSKYRFFGRKFLYGIAIFVMLVPIVGSFASQYKIYHSLHMLNSPLILLAFASGFGMDFLIMSASFDSVSWSYAEAAFIDGAGHFKVFFVVILPQVFAPMSALFIVSFIGAWNDYMTPYIFLRDLPTLSTGLYLYAEASNNDFNLGFTVYLAGVVIVMIPAFVLFLIFQNTIMDMTLSGGVKE